ncbi:MAG: RNA polymerase sigma factor [Candidatus Pacebacteria bacterium]|nr:RNA polymerase sigma factor [Candidatus Paceibacterota bacterium]MDD4831223.1 RNA polymerase sigma factor [Candidatus Paceibacterota bacterium]MDD4875453.1 RNA polymerase sigma factor [Candidatus Paceibacterota bacterium]
MDNDNIKKENFSKLYQEKIGKIYRFIYLKIGSEPIAQDIAAETFTRYWQQVCRDKDIKNPSAFLFRTAHNLVADHYRSRDNRYNLDIDKYFSLKDDKVDIERKAVLADDAKQVHAALARLRGDWRQAISLYYIDKAPIGEVAQALDKTEAATRVIIHRALKQLRRIIEEA